MLVEIGTVVIERQDGSVYCGMLFYTADKSSRYVPWSIDLQNLSKIVLKLFPPNTKQHYELVREHYECMADAIVDHVMASRK